MFYFNLYFLPTILGLAPIILWLIFFLWQDIKKPEPAKWLIAVFFLGMIMIPVAILLQLIWANLLKIEPLFKPSLSSVSFLVIIFYGGIALIEELVKFFSVFLFLKKNPYFNEAIDAMIYLVVLALGFSAIENILYMNAEIKTGIAIIIPFKILILRFIGANLLHALCSGIIGFFWAWHLLHRRFHYLIIGIFLGTGLHWLFNLAIIIFGAEIIFSLSLILFVITIFLLWAFDVLVKIEQPISHPEKII